MRKQRQRAIAAWLRSKLGKMPVTKTGLRALRKALKFAGQNKQCRPFDEKRETARKARAAARKARGRKVTAC